MQDKSLEPLSAMMDGEIESFELRRVIERIAENDELKAKWSRYHLAQDVMQGRNVDLSLAKDAQQQEMKTGDFVARVSAAIDLEPSFDSQTIEKTEKRVKKQDSAPVANQWWKPVASMAVAASVTAVVLLGSQQFSSDPILSAPTVAVADSADNGMPPSRFASGLSTVSARVNTSQADSLRAAQGMERYIQRHKDLSFSQPGQWQVNWVPEGYAKVKENVSASSQVMLFKKNDSTISINIEDIGSQTSSHGVLNNNDLLAYGANVNDKFVTVVGKLSAQQAAKIAASVSTKNR